MIRGWTGALLILGVMTLGAIGTPAHAGCNGPAICQKTFGGTKVFTSQNLQEVRDERRQELIDIAKQNEIAGFSPGGAWGFMKKLNQEMGDRVADTAAWAAATGQFAVSNEPAPAIDTVKGYIMNGGITTANALRKWSVTRGILSAINPGEWHHMQSAWACFTASAISPGTGGTNSADNSWQVAMSGMASNFARRATERGPQALVSSGLISLLFVFSTIALIIQAFQSGILNAGSLESMMRPVARVVGAAILVALISTPEAAKLFANLAGYIISFGGEAHYQFARNMGTLQGVQCSGAETGWNAVREYSTLIFFAAGNASALGFSTGFLQIPNLTETLASFISSILTPSEMVVKIILFVTALGIMFTSMMLAITISVRVVENLLAATLYLVLTPILLWLTSFRSTQRTAALPLVICGQTALNLFMLGIGADLAVQIMITGIDFYGSLTWGSSWGFSGNSAQDMMTALLTQHESNARPDIDTLTETFPGVMTVMMSSLLAKGITDMCCQVGTAIMQIANLDTGASQAIGNQIKNFTGKIFRI